MAHTYTVTPKHLYDSNQSLVIECFVVEMPPPLNAEIFNSRREAEVFQREKRKAERNEN